VPHMTIDYWLIGICRVTSRIHNPFIILSTICVGAETPHMNSPFLHTVYPAILDEKRVPKPYDE